MARKVFGRKSRRRVFISYRRIGGIDTARWLYDQLRARGYDVFMDLEGLRAGVFNKALYREIESRDTFVIVLSEGSLDRCVNEGDWVRQELAHALNCKRNVIPILMKGFKFPDQLPEDIDAIRSYHGVPVSYDFFDAFMDKIEEFIDGPNQFPWKKYVAAGLAAFALLAGAFLLGRSGAASGPSEETKETGNQTSLSATESTEEATTEPTEEAATSPTEGPVLPGNTVTNLCNGGVITMTPERNAVLLTSPTVHWLNMLMTEPDTKFFYESKARTIYTRWTEGGEPQSEDLVKDVNCQYLYATYEWLYFALEEADGSYTLYRAENRMETHSIGPREPVVKNVLPNNRIAITEDYIYYWIRTEGLFRCGLDGSNPQLLFNNGGSHNLFGLITFHVTEEDVYFWASTGGIYSVPVEGGGHRYLLDTKKMEGVLTHAVALDGYAYYVMEHSSDGDEKKPAEIWRVRLDGTENQQIATLQSGTMEILCVNASDWLYLKIKDGQNTYLYKLPPNGGEPELVCEL